jgi:autotransporter-associated beta strand protein
VGIKVGPHTIADPNGGGDNAAFSRITSSTLPAGLALSLGNLTESKSLAVNAGVALTIDTSLMVGGASYTLSGDISGGGNIIKGGAGALILSGVTTTTGTATVNAGSLVLNGTHAFSSITIASGATVSGSGSATAASINIAAGGHVAPGNSVGTMTVGTITIAGSLDAEASANGVNDLLITTNTIWSAGASVNLTLLGGFTPGPGNSFDLVNGTISGTTPTFNLPALSSGLTWNTSQFMSTGVLSVVPEPSGILLSLAGAGFLLRRRRR